MQTGKIHFEPLRPNRSLRTPEKYEFTHGNASVCVYDIESLDFIKEIPLGPRPDCHGTSLNNRYLYMACEDGMYCVDQESLEVTAKLDTGHVYGVNVMPDGSSMLLHDAYGGIFILKDIQDMDKIHIHKRLDIFSENKLMETLGGKGNFIENGRIYLANGWNKNNMYAIDLEDDYSFEIFMKDVPELKMGDDLVISRDAGKAYSACYNDRINSYVAVTDIAGKKIIKTIKTGSGTCGLTMSLDERYVIASNDMDESISVIDTDIDEVVSTVSAKKGFEQIKMTGYIQGLSVAQDGGIFVYGCSGTGALVKFEDILREGRWTISWPGGKITGTGRV